MRLADKVQEWLDAKEWEDEIRKDEDEQTSVMSTLFEIHEQTFNLYVETDEKRDWIKLFFYAPVKVKENKRSECAELFNFISSRFSIGSLHFTDDGRIRFRHIVDFENTEPSVQAINNMLNSATAIFEEWFEAISSVALTKMTAQQVIDDLEKSQEEEKDEEVPEEI